MAAGCDGARSATLSSPALTSSDSGEFLRRGSTRVSGAGPELLRQRLGAGRKFHMAAGFFQVGDMHDQGIEQRPALGGENRGHRLAVGGVGAQAVNRLGGEGDQAAIAQDARGLGDAFGVGGHGLGLNVDHGGAI